MENRRKKATKIETVDATKNITEARAKFLLNCKARNIDNVTIENYEKATRYFVDFD